MTYSNDITDEVKGAARRQLDDKRRRYEETRQRLLDDADAILARSGDTLTDSDQERIDKITAEVDDLDQEWNRAKASLEKLANYRGRYAGVPSFEGAPFATVTRRDPHADRSPFTGMEPHAEVRDRAMAALETLERRDVWLDRASTMVDRHPEAARLAVALSDPAYERAFAKVLAHGVGDGVSRFTDDERGAWARAMSLTDAEGGYGVPIVIDPTWILQADQSRNYLRRVSRVETGVAPKWRGIATAGVTASFAAEATEVADGSPSDLSQPTVTAHKAHAFVKASYELAGDYSTLSQEVGRAFAFAKDSLEATKFTVGAGDGSNEPVGFVTALDANTNAELANTTNNTFSSVTEVYRINQAVGDRYRDRSSWHMNLATLDTIRQFGDSELHQQTVDLTEGGVPRILGHPVYENAEMDGVISVDATDNLIVLGDFSEFLIYDRLGATVVPVPVLFGTTNGRPTGEQGWYFYWRTGSDVVNDATATSGRPFVLFQTETN